MKKSLMVLLFLLTAHCSLLAAFAQGTPGTVRFPGNVDTVDSLFGQLTDNPQTTVSGVLSSGATTITVVASGTAGFGSSGSLKIDNEVIYYTGKSSTQFTGCVRGRDGTIATSHASGTLVKSPILSVHHRTLANAIIATQSQVNGIASGLAGLGTIAAQDSDDVAITGGTLSGVSFGSGFSVSGTATATNFIGNGSGLTGITAACSGGGCSGTSSTTALSLIADSNSSGSDGIIDLINAGVTRLRVNVDGTARMPTNTTIGFSDETAAGINFRNAASFNRTIEWLAGTAGPGPMPYKLGAYFTDRGSFQTGVDVIMSNKRVDINGRIQGVSALPDGSEPSMLSISPDVNGPSIAVEGYGSMGAGNENQTVFAAYDLESISGGATSYSPGYGTKKFAIGARGQMFWGSDLGTDPAANAEASLSVTGGDLIFGPRLNVVSPDDASLRLDGADANGSGIEFRKNGVTKWQLVQLNYLDFGSGPQFRLRAPDGSWVVAIDAATNNIGISQDPDSHKFSVTGDVASTGAFFVDGVQVVSNRQTGWGSPTGTATRTTFATTTVTTEQLAQRLKALIDDLTTHGLVGP